MTDTDLIICQNVIFGMRKQNPMELKDGKGKHPDFIFMTFWERIQEENYQGTEEEALLWWNNRKAWAL